MTFTAKGLLRFVGIKHGAHLTDLPVQLSKEDELGLNKQRKKFDIREEYYVR